MTMHKENQEHQPQAYRITLQGQIGERWKYWFNGLTFTNNNSVDDQPMTILTGYVIDQVELRGILNRLWDLNLELIAVNRLDRDAE